jgi:hypothetical protein
VFQIKSTNEMKKQIQMVKRIIEQIPSSEFTVGSGWGACRRRRILAHYLIDEARHNYGVFLDSSQQGIILFYPSENKKPVCWKVKLMMIFIAVGPLRLKRVMQRKAQVEKMRSNYPAHLYCSFLGVLPEARGSQAIFELRDILFQKSKELNLPVMVETVIPKNKRIYERIGFKTYSQVEIDGLITYCLIRDLDQNG